MSFRACRSKLDCFAALAMTAESVHSRSSRYTGLRHCEEQSDEAIQLCGSEAGLLRCARDDAGRAVSQITCPAPNRKIFAFLSNAKHLPNRAVSSHRGALAIVTDAGRDAMDANTPLTNCAERGRRSRVVLTPRRWRQVLRKQSDCDNKARSPGRARRKPLKPSRAGMPGYPACLW